MNKETFNVLLIEDSPTYALLIQGILTDAEQLNPLAPAFHLVHVEALSDGLKQLSQGGVDVVLLDLNLPDSQGLDTVRRTHAHATDIPIVLLTSDDDETLGVKAIQEGAQDYLSKGQEDQQTLVRAIQYAIERQHRILDEIHQREQAAREHNSLERISRSSQTSVTAQTFGVVALRENAPELFEKLVQHFMQTIDHALEQRILRVEYHIGDELRSIGEQLGFVKAGPRDVIDIYVAALKSVSENAPSKKAQAYAEEGRLLVLELMGNLVSFYRKYYSGSSYQ